MTRVVVVGGGYAGLACLCDLRTQLPGAELVLLDPAAAHLKQTRLHEAVSRPLDELQVPFAHLAERVPFRHVRGVAGRRGCFTLEDVGRWQRAGSVPVAGGPEGVDELPFDYLVLATGAGAVLTPPAGASPGGTGEAPPGGSGTACVLSLNELREVDLRGRLRELSADVGEAGLPVSIVGAGATGLQYAFELAEAVRRLGFQGTVRVLDESRRLLPDLPERAHRYVEGRLRAAAIDWLGGCRFTGQTGDRLTYRVIDSDTQRSVTSRLTLLLAGVRARPVVIPANRFGQVRAGGQTLSNVLTAGDCAHLDADGSNAATAQTAVRQGKHMAVNISRLRRRREPMPWVYRELGYVVSLGAVDAVGWLFSPENVLTGMAAVGIKSLVDAQYDLYLEGIDTYVL